jgi:TolB-like protein/Tfp pilus assembly protein PilF
VLASNKRVGMSVNRRLAAIMVADVVGYSKLMEADEAGTLGALDSRQKKIIEPLVRKHSGRIVKLMGDGQLIEFPSAVNAMSCALAMQSQMAEANGTSPPDRHIQLRIGLNLGDLIEQGSDIFGDGVNITARLEALAEPGGICLSGKIYEEVRGKLDISVEDLGEVPLKNIARPVRAYRTATGAERWTPDEKPIRRKAREQTAIAVLPFTNMSGANEHDYFADGVAEDLTIELSGFGHLAVMSRNATAAYKGKLLDSLEIGRRLGVDFVVEGSVRRSDNRVRVTAQLIDIESGTHVWADKFDREIDDIFAVQDEIVTTILARLTFNLDDAAADQRRRSPTTSVTAYSHFLQARAAWRRGNENEARDRLLAAIDADPHYARALAYLGFFFAYSRFSLAAGLDDADAVKQARHYSERAIAADPNDAFTLHRCAMAYLMLGEPLTALRYIEVAAARRPRELEVMQARGIILAFAGKHAEGLASLEKAAKLEPVLPPGFHATLSDTRYLAGDYQGALDALDRIVELPPYMAFCQAAFLAQLGRTEEARRRVATVPEKYDAARFAQYCAGMCALPEDAAHWLAGFRKAGIDV